jgi:hypothetical protein
MKIFICICAMILILAAIGVVSKTISKNEKIELIKIENKYRIEALKLKLEAFKNVNVNITIQDSLFFTEEEPVAASKFMRTRKAIQNLLDNELEIAVGESTIY